MQAQTWYIISLAGYFIALALLILTVVLYFKLDILDVLGDLTGRTVARELKNMRENRGSRSAKNSPAMKRYNKTSSTSKSRTASRQGRKTTGSRTAVGSTGSTATGRTQGMAKRRAKNGTAEIGFSSGKTDAGMAASDKRVLHSKTDRLNNETEKLYEDFDPRIEYSRTDKLDDGTAPAEAQTPKKGTAVLVERGTAVLEERGTAVLERGTVLLEEDSAAKGTCLLEEVVEPVKFTVTRSYIVVHSQEEIL